MSQDTEGPDGEPTPAARATGGATFSRVLAGMVFAVVGANVVLLSAFGSRLGQFLEDQRAAAALVLVGALLLAVVLPGLGLGATLRRLSARGMKVRVGRIVAAGLLAWNTVGIGLVVWATPEGPARLLADRGTWVVDGLRGVGPFGPAAIPAVQRLLTEARETAHLRDAAPLLSDASAAGEAAQLLLLLDASRDLRADGDSANQQLDRLLGRYELDPETLRTGPGDVAVADGRALLADVLELVPDGGGVAGDGAQRTWAWPAQIPEDVQLEPVSRTSLALSEPSGWEARWEDGAWRLHTGELPDYVARAGDRLGTAGLLAPARGAGDGRTASAPDRGGLSGRNADSAVDSAVDGANPPGGGAPPINPHAGPAGAALGADVAPVHADDSSPSALAIREALRAAARGRFGAQAETAAFASSWPDALTREAAAQQGERVRAWCVAAAGDDPLFTGDHRQLFADWQLGAPTEAITNAQLEQLSRRGRQWLADVLEICAPVVAAQQESDAALGNPVPDARRMRWAERDADELVRSAVVALGAEEGSATVALPGGVVREAVLQDGAWRVHWPD